MSVCVCECCFPGLRNISLTYLCLHLSCFYLRSWRLLPSPLTSLNTFSCFFFFTLLLPPFSCRLLYILPLLHLLTAFLQHSSLFCITLHFVSHFYFTPCLPHLFCADFTLLPTFSSTSHFFKLSLTSPLISSSYKVHPTYFSSTSLTSILYIPLFSQSPQLTLLHIFPKVLIFITLQPILTSHFPFLSCI